MAVRVKVDMDMACKLSHIQEYDSLCERQSCLWYVEA
jgi:hypothetical protein